MASLTRNGEKKFSNHSRTFIGVKNGVNTIETSWFLASFKFKLMKLAKS